MPTKIYNEINNFVIKAKKLLGDRLKKIILYGSYARGDYNTNSDIDIMLLTDLSDDEIVKYRQTRDKLSHSKLEELLVNYRDYQNNSADA